jgi:hypothetical protein
MKKFDPKKITFTPVAMFFIILGAFFFVLGGYMIFFRILPVPYFYSLLISMGGVMIMALGYIQLELGLIRKK